MNDGVHVTGRESKCDTRRLLIGDANTMLGRCDNVKNDNRFSNGRCTNHST